MVTIDDKFGVTVLVFEFIIVTVDSAFDLGVVEDGEAVVVTVYHKFCFAAIDIKFVVITVDYEDDFWAEDGEVVVVPYDVDWGILVLDGVFAIVTADIHLATTKNN